MLIKNCKNSKNFYSLFLVIILIIFMIGACTKPVPVKPSDKTTTKTTEKATTVAQTTKKLTTSQNSTATMSTLDDSKYEGEEDSSFDSDEEMADASESENNEVEEYEYFDFKGAEIIFSSASDLYEKNLKLYRETGEAENPGQTIFFKRALELEKKYNFNLKCITLENTWWESTFPAEVLSGVCDLSIVNPFPRTNHPNMVNNLYTKLNDYVDIENHPYINMKAKAFMEYVRYNGNYYAWPYDSIGLSTYWILANNDIFNREGLVDIYDLYKSGQWTWDMFNEYAIQTTRDLNGDGIIDQWGVTSTNPARLLNELLKTNGVCYVEKNSEGRYIFNLNSPAAYTTLNFFQNILFVEKVYGGNFAAFQQGKIAMYFEAATSHSKVCRDKGLNCSFVAPPRGPNVSELPTILAQCQCYAVPVSAPEEQKKALIEIMIELGTPGADPECPDPLDNFRVLFAPRADSRDIEAYLATADLNRDSKVDYSSGITDFTEKITNPIVDSLVKGNSPGSVVDAYAIPGQKLIDDFFKQ